MSIQLSLDFSKGPVLHDDGKKLEKITFTGSCDLKEYLHSIATKQRCTVSELCQKYVIQGMTKDISDILLLQLSADKKVSDLLHTP